MKRKYFGWAGLALIAAYLAFPLARAVADQGYYVIDQSARTGMLMSVSGTDSNVAERATSERSESLVGVLGDQPTSFDFQEGQRNILTGGIGNTLVSTIDGDIKNGDYIAVSSVIGLGSKLVGSGWAVGIAQADFNSSTEGAVVSTVADSSGQQREVHVGAIPVLVKVHYNDDSVAKSDRDVSVIPESLQQKIESIIGRKASQVAIILAFILIVTGLILGSIIAYSAIKTGISSTARQPLAKEAIVRRMVQSCLIALVIVFTSIVGAFVLVRIF